MLALVTADVAAPLDPDLEPFARACRAEFGDDRVSIVSWDDASVEWEIFDAAIIRSTWDYTDRIDEFLAWVDRVGDATRLVNSADAIRWSADKWYLAELAADGVPVVPTVYVRPGDRVPSVEGVHVVKPTIGAGSSGARRCERDEVADHVATLHDAGRTAMVQPYLDRLDADGEVACCFVADGAGLTFSHAFRKAAILTTTEVEQEGGLFAKEEIVAAEPTAAQRMLAEATLATDIVRSFTDVTFARVDIAPHADDVGRGHDVVMELELIEPSFYLATAPGAAERFARRLAARLRVGTP